MLRSALTLTLAALLSGCATVGSSFGEHEPAIIEIPGGGVALYSNLTAPMAYRTEVSPPKNFQGKIRDVKGKACQKGFAIPLSTKAGWPTVKWGEGGAHEALNEINQRINEPHWLTDIKVDNHIWSFLIFREQCVSVTAKAMIAN